MKNIILIFCFVLAFVFTNAQNLVPNPSFELYDTCPYQTGQVQFVNSWSNYGYTPDYYNACATNYMSVPNNWLGYLPAYNGNAYCAVILYDQADSIYQEFIGATLNSALQIGQRYYVSAEFSLASQMSYNMATNKVCIKFSTVGYSENSPPLYNNFAQIVSDTFITTIGSWYKLKGSFIADSAYTKIIIGNFYQNYLIDTLWTNDNASNSYYFVDLVCVSTDSNTCYSTSGEGIETVNKLNNNVGINLINDNIILTNNLPYPIVATLSITDILGRQIFTKQMHLDKTDKIPIQYLNSSIYLISIQTNNNIQTIKFIKK